VAAFTLRFNFIFFPDKLNYQLLEDISFGAFNRDILLESIN